MLRDAGSLFCQREWQNTEKCGRQRQMFEALQWGQKECLQGFLNFQFINANVKDTINRVEWKTQKLEK